MSVWELNCCILFFIYISHSFLNFCWGFWVVVLFVLTRPFNLVFSGLNLVRIPRCTRRPPDVCGNSWLEPNVNRTSKLVVTFSTKLRQLTKRATTNIMGKSVQAVEEYRCLSTTFDRFLSPTGEILKKWHQRQYIFSKISFGANEHLMMTF